MSMTFKDTFHYYHKGVESNPNGAWVDAQHQIAAKWAGFLKAMTDTSNVQVQDVQFDHLGGTTARLGLINNVSVTGAGSKTQHPTWSGERSWETWFDVHFDLSMVFFPTGAMQPAQSGLSATAFQSAIAQGAGDAVH